MFNNFIKLYQLDIPELSGYIAQFFQSATNTTGQLTGAFYPLTSNPSGYITSGQTSSFITTGQTGNFVSLLYLNSALTSFAIQESFLYYPLTNPSGFITSGYLTGLNFLNNSSFFITGKDGIYVSGSGNILTIGQTGGFGNFLNGQFSISGTDGIYVSGSGSNILVGQTNPTFGFNFGSGNLSLIGLGNITVSGSGQTIFINETGGNNSLNGFINFSGVNGINVISNANNNIIISGANTGNFITTSQTGNFVLASNTGSFINLFYPLNSNPNGFLTSINTGSFVSINRLNATGNYLFNLINDNVLSINNITGDVIVSGRGNISVMNTGQFIFISGNTGAYSNFVLKTQTGIFALQSSLNNVIAYTATLFSNLSGYSNTTFVKKTDTGNFITTGQTGSFGNAVNTGSLTGSFYPLYSNPSGYITTGQTGSFGNAINTGILTGAFYPLVGNPSGFILPSQTGIFITTSQTGSFVTTGQTGNFITNYQTGIFITTSQTGQFAQSGLVSANTVQISNLNSWTGNSTGIYYPLNTNPNGYISSFNQSGAYIFSILATSGVSQQFINFPNSLGSNPFVIPSLSNVSGLENIIVQSSGIVSSGYWAQYSNTIDSSGYVLTTIASFSSATGLSSLSIVQNQPSTWTYLNGTGVVWNAQTNVVEDHKILILTGNSSLSISGLYNGWCGVLQTIQSGLSSSGFLLTLPSGARVINNNSGVLNLTNISGAIDMIGLVYDGMKLFASIGNYFN